MERAGNHNVCILSVDVADWSWDHLGGVLDLYYNVLNTIVYWNTFSSGFRAGVYSYTLT
jgi:hypothetical protein